MDMHAKTLPLLSIYIPTYRRMPQFQCLAQLLDLELSSLGLDHLAAKAFVEVIVSSNYPPDLPDIASIIDNLECRDFFTLVSPPYTLTAGDNVVSGASFSSGRYVWILCDDDIPKKGSICCLLELLISLKPTLLFLHPDIIENHEAAHGYISAAGYVEDAFIRRAYGSDGMSSISADSLERIDGEWMVDHVDSMLRASSLVYDRIQTHRYWVCSAYSRGSPVTPMALALDAYEAGESYHLCHPIYAYVDVHENKKDWVTEWPCILYLQVYPLAIAFLRSKGLESSRRFKTLPSTELKEFVKSIVKHPGYLLRPSAVLQLMRYFKEALQPRALWRWRNRSAAL